MIILTDAPDITPAPCSEPEFLKEAERILSASEPLLSAFRGLLYGPDGKRLPSTMTFHGAKLEPMFEYAPKPNGEPT